MIQKATVLSTFYKNMKKKYRFNFKKRLKVCQKVRKNVVSICILKKNVDFIASTH